MKENKIAKTIYLVVLFGFLVWLLKPVRVNGAEATPNPHALEELESVIETDGQLEVEYRYLADPSTNLIYLEVLKTRNHEDTYGAITPLYNEKGKITTRKQFESESAHTFKSLRLYPGDTKNPEGWEECEYVVDTDTDQMYLLLTRYRKQEITGAVMPLYDTNGNIVTGTRFLSE